MAEQDFITRYQALLAEYTRMSRMAGGRSDYVQGGGGNTSVKLDNRLMAIKASGYRLDQIAPETAYAVLDYAALRAFYQSSDPNELPDIESAGSARAKAATEVIEGLPALRPSVEAGFHSLLETFVLHTHPVYANLATCCSEGEAVAKQALAGIDAGHVYVPYINPGAQLTFAIAEARNKAQAENGNKPAIIFMQNHGLIVTGADADSCLRLHDEVNERIAAFFGTSRQDWPQPALAPAAAGNSWLSATPWLSRKLIGTAWDLDLFTARALYPDQLVFLGGQLTEVKTGSLADHLMAGRPFAAKCSIFRESGEVYYHQCAAAEARTIEETLCAILYITDTIINSGRTVCTMNEAGRDFISSWESEKYRKSIAAK